MAKRLGLDDLARLCGVSRATVDRVLNKRAGVRAGTIAKVNAVLDTLGYASTTLAARLPGQFHTIDIILPEGTNPFFAELHNGFDAAALTAARHGCISRFHGCDPYHPETLVAALQAIPEKTDAVILVGVDTPDVATAIRAVVARGIRVVTAISDVPSSGRSVYVGQDNFLAGRTAGRLMAGMLHQTTGTVVVLPGHLQFRHILDRQSGFQQYMGMTKPGLRLQSAPAYGNDPQVARQIVTDQIARYSDLAGVYLAGGGQPAVIDGLTGLTAKGIITLAHEVNPISRAALLSAELTAIVGHDPREVGQKAIDAALAHGVISGMCSINIYLADNLPSP